ncbi:hypothetical protein EJ05DRAFT_44286 [Pseudovirgaria hyperparasitica]|uniref:Protein BNI4 n=1 Tax=Pseudovirgaria hyperparasitica TaxID=470096 RepID=A0A6A6W2M3_9PEZI|nr:uncharacterized protein EJ05DRAFT_44286 [Pseudovirgaria hyperparasitica]KAF2756805.1 hypothetical protein EJ05DRAFT_44286 [Pseudovirgaria hyperparasitica]
MAEVLAPIIQQSGSMTMLHSPSDAFQKTSQPSHSSRSNQMPRTHTYNSQNGGSGYRGTSAAPVAPYAFSATPQLRQEQHRTLSAPSVPLVNPGTSGNMNPRQWQPSHVSTASDSTASTVSSGNSVSAAKGDASKTEKSSTIPPFAAAPDLSLAFDSVSKPSPDRYRRSARRTEQGSSSSLPITPPTMSRSAMPSGSGMPNVAHLYNLNVQQPIAPVHHRTTSVDDLHVRTGASDQAKRYRRRSLGGLDGDAFTNAPRFVQPTTKAVEKPPIKGPDSNDARRSPNADRPASHTRQGSHDSGSSHRPSSRASSRPSSSKQDQTRPASSAGSRSDQRNINIPPRGSSDANKRLVAPSPLSKPMSSGETDSVTPSTPTETPQSPAVQRLTALNDGKADNKGMKSRLRRAFSFGSAAELRRATAENNLTSERAKLRKEGPHDELDPEDAAIAAKQEAAGIGAGIYSGQGGFSGSTDNLSISSTASSASIMLRKMGKGMKKGGRSIKGLFRPKSVIGVPAADTALAQPSQAQVSMVTVEAEREKVNVNADPHDQVGGGTAYPKLERNSIDASTVTDVGRPSSMRGQAGDASGRKSIMGGDRERAEVLAGIRKGILKRPMDGSSPILRPVDGLQQVETPVSSAPSTPKDDHSRPVQLPITEDYFNGIPRFGNSSTKSLPNTPNSRNISFSPRIQFHDAWSSSEYDRRGDVATCNRLTPMLAQQIKEELNSFKMEMEVHELSKPHTHFF